MPAVAIPDNIRSCAVEIEFIGDGKSLVLHPCDDEQEMLLAHWARISRNAVRTHAFSMWAKFVAEAMIDGQRRRYHGCYIMLEDPGYVLRWDLWENR